MKRPTELGMNRTGIETSPIDAKATLEGAELGGDTSVLDHDGLASIRREYTEDAEPIGTMPPPGTIQGAVKAVVGAIGKDPTVFLDKLGERIAFERAGTRLYDALLTKLDASESWEAGPTHERLAGFRDEELAHFHLVWDAMKKMGGDPTAVTPSADLVGVEGSGLLAVVTDPRTTLDQALGAVLVAELADNAGWSLLSTLATAMGEEQLATGFLAALAEEQKHLEAVRGWIDGFVRAKAMKEEPKAA
jgi:hypothetical protein